MKKLIIILAVLIIGGAIGWYTISPLFIDEVVDEELVFDRNARAPQASDPLPETQSNGETVTETTKNDPIEPEPSGTLPPEDPIIEELENDERGPESEEPEPPPPAIPLVLAEGTFSGSDAFHKGSGDAFIIETEDGNVLRFENFDVTNGPDLRVLLSPSENPTGRSSLGEYIELGKLKGNIGNQNYDISSDIDTGTYKSVVIYCDPFNVVFATATLE